MLIITSTEFVLVWNWTLQIEQCHNWLWSSDGVCLTMESPI